jgi:hypothetical protein
MIFISYDKANSVSYKEKNKIKLSDRPKLICGPQETNSGSQYDQQMAMEQIAWVMFFCTPDE